MVLGSANIAEGLRGYYTKYDCSSADLNPIGGINKSDIKTFLKYFGLKADLPALVEISEATPSAELRPQTDKDSIQADEDEMGMSYAELDEYGEQR